MVQPVVLSVPTPLEPRQTFLVIGEHFGQVNAAWLVDPAGVSTIAVTFLQVADGQHCIVTVPPNIVTDKDYYVELATINDEVSDNEAGLVHVRAITGVVPAPEPAPVPDPLPLPAPGESVGLDRLRKRVRVELSDQAQTFQATVVGDGATTRYDLPVRHIDPMTLIVVRIPSDEPSQNVPLAAGADYVVDAFDGLVILTSPLPALDALYVTGTRYRFFIDETLDMFIETAFAQITKGREITTVGVNPYGFREFSQHAITYDTLPEVEILPTALLAKIEALWVLATDAAYDIDISADGASIPRTERYRQLMAQIQAEEARVHPMLTALNIGLDRLEVTTLRRVSRTTGRLVPIYVAKEYDDRATRPVRVLPPIDHGVGEGTEFVDPYYSGYGGR
jgi:hypothetical protein